MSENGAPPVDRRKKAASVFDLAEFGKGVFEGSPDCIKLMDMQGHILAMNRNGQCAMEIDDFETVRGVHWRVLWAEESRAAVDAAIAAAQTGRSDILRLECRTTKGAARWWEVTVSPILGSGGEVARILAVSRDITEARSAAEKIRVSEERFRSLVTATASIVWGTAGSGHFHVDQPAWSAFTGQLVEEIFGLGWLDAVHPDDRHRATSGWADAISAGAAFETEHRLRRADGQFRHMSVRAVPIMGPDKAVLEWVGIHIDIHDRKLAEGVLRDTEQRIRLATASAELGLWAWYPGTDAVVWENDRPYEIFGLPRDAPPVTARQFLTDFVLSEYVVEFGQAVTLTIETGAHLHFQGRIKRTDGRVRWVEFFGNLQPHHDGDPLRIIGTVSDITANKEREEELRRLAANLSEADRRKTEFLAVLAHELRNPLAPIRHGLQLIRSQAVQAETFGKVRDMLDRQVDQMVRLVNDLLDVARITSGKVELRKQAAEIAELVKGAVETSMPLIEASGHTLVVSVPEAPIWVFVDPGRVSQVISNLLNNAAKYTPSGGTISLNVVLEGTDVMIAVADNGVGIAAHAIGTVFDLFRQVGQDFERSQGGLGIGLSLVRQLIDMHGGTTSAHSAGEGKGSTFTARLAVSKPATKVLPANLARPEGQGSHSLRILIADDNADAADIFCLLLQVSGHTVEVAHDGRTAVNMARTSLPDVVFLDIGMPGMNGFETAKAMRNIPALSNIILVALTGWGSEEDKIMSHEAGFDHHLIKPVDLKVIEQLIADTVESSRLDGRRH